jgi:hypothetical protein
MVFKDPCFSGPKNPISPNMDGPKIISDPRKKRLSSLDRAGNTTLVGKLHRKTNPQILDRGWRAPCQSLFILGMALRPSARTPRKASPTIPNLPNHT